jgi:hypothetical protein
MFARIVEVRYLVHPTSIQVTSHSNQKWIIQFFSNLNRMSDALQHLIFRRIQSNLPRISHTAGCQLQSILRGKPGNFLDITTGGISELDCREA